MIDKHGRYIQSRNPLRMALLVVALAAAVGVAIGVAAGDRIVDHMLGADTPWWDR